MIGADSYSTVYLTEDNGRVLEFTGDYGGNELFEAGDVITEVLVYGNGTSARKKNPDLDACLSTSTATADATATDAPTPTSTATPTPTPIDNPEMEIESESWVAVDGQQRRYKLTATATNPYDRPFEVQLYARIWYSDTESVSLGGAGRIQLDPGESKTTDPWTTDDRPDDVIRHEITQTVYDQ